MYNKQRGFTLVELLVVVSVIALLLAIAVPSLGKARNYARQTACKSQLHNVALAFRMYLDDNHNTMPPAAGTPWSFTDPAVIASPRPALIQFLGLYLSVSSTELASVNKKCYCKALSCPGDKRDGTPQYYFKIQQSSYAYNEMLGGRILDKAAFRSTIKTSDMEAMGDFDAFHGTKGTLGSFNYLFADCHVGDRKGY
jgi:prepilin-type N-terminal cleavage/methylation domain-containing protein/prepilin-type processing-associated H-X9-DG protein